MTQRKNVDLLIVLNIFGHHRNEKQQIEYYKESIRGIQKQISNSPDHSFRVVVSACMVSGDCVQTLKKEFGDEIHVFHFQDRYTCQVTTNSTVLKAIEHFNEEYEGYLYYSSGIFFADDSEDIQPTQITNEHNKRDVINTRTGNPKIFDSIVKKLKTEKYGIIQLQVSDDHGYHFLGFGQNNWVSRINFQYDYVIPIGNHGNFHIAAIHKSLKDYYGKPISDIHGFCGMESTLSYCCAALRKQYILMGDSLVVHHQKFDNDHSAPGRMLNTNGVKVIGCQGANDDPCRDLLWGRRKEEISNDPSAIEYGLGYYPGPASCNEVDWNGVRLVHKADKYDNNYLTLEPKLKEAVKRLFYTNETELNYDHICCEIF
jgi:hypothetical protein